MLPGTMPTTCAKVCIRNPRPRCGMALPHSLKNDCARCRPGKALNLAIRCQRVAPTMIHAHSLGRAARYFAGRPALASGRRRSTFRELRDRVASIAAALHSHGFAAGDRLALLLPNEREYIELVYACAWLGVIAVPSTTGLPPADSTTGLTPPIPPPSLPPASPPPPPPPPPHTPHSTHHPLAVSSNSC